MAQMVFSRLLYHCKVAHMAGVPTCSTGGSCFPLNVDALNQEAAGRGVTLTSYKY